MVKVDGSGKSSLIQVRDLDKTYRRAEEDIEVLHGLNLDVEKGEFVAFMGPSGSGKTTLLNLLGGLDVPTRGSITVAGDEITHLSAGKLTEWRARHVGFIFQIYNLIPVLNAFKNVELPLLLTNLSKAERRATRRNSSRRGWPCRQDEPFPPPAFRRARTARSNRSRYRRRSDFPSLRRANRRSRP